MAKEKFLPIVIFLLVQTIYSQAQSVCGKCDPGSGVACISENTYYVCTNGVADTTMTQSCGSTEVCTSLGTVCAPKSGSEKPLCTAPKCGSCTGGAFTCLSKTKYALCYNNEVSDIRSQCSNGYVCNTDGNEVCRPGCKTVPSCDKPD